MADVPIANFHIMHDYFGFKFLQDYPYCKQLDLDIKFGDFEGKVEELISGDFTEEFKKARKSHLFEKGQVSKRILDYFKEKR